MIASAIAMRGFQERSLPYLQPADVAQGPEAPRVDALQLLKNRVRMLHPDIPEPQLIGAISIVTPRFVSFGNQDLARHLFDNKPPTLVVLGDSKKTDAELAAPPFNLVPVDRGEIPYRLYAGVLVHVFQDGLRGNDMLTVFRDEEDRVVTARSFPFEVPLKEMQDGREGVLIVETKQSKNSRTGLKGLGTLARAQMLPKGWREQLRAEKANLAAQSH